MLAVRVASFASSCHRDARWQLYEPEEFMHITTVSGIGFKTLGENCEEDKGKGDSYAR
jgi:hypothetical protein